LVFFFVVTTSEKPIIIYRGEKTEGLAIEYLITIIVVVAIVLILILAVFVRVRFKKKKSREETLLMAES